MKESQSQGWGWGWGSAPRRHHGRTVETRVGSRRQGLTLEEQAVWTEGAPPPPQEKGKEKDFFCSSKKMLCQGEYRDKGMPDEFSFYLETLL